MNIVDYKNCLFHDFKFKFIKIKFYLLQVTIVRKMIKRFTNNLE